MVKARRIGHATFETPDMERMIDYYTEVIGLVLAEREKDRAFLASKVGLLAIAINKGAAERCTSLSFEVARDSDFGALARALEKDGVKSELRNDAIPGIGPVLTFEDNKGTTISLFKEWSYLGKRLQQRPKTWAAGGTKIWGPPPLPDFSRAEGSAGVVRSGWRAGGHATASS